MSGQQGRGRRRARPRDRRTPTRAERGRSYARSQDCCGRLSMLDGTITKTATNQMRDVLSQRKALAKGLGRMSYEETEEMQAAADDMIAKTAHWLTLPGVRFQVLRLTAT